MLLTLLRYFWSSRRLVIISYCSLAIAYATAMYFYSRKSSHDFNALVVFGAINLTFFLYSPFLAQRLVYKNYQHGAHYFFMALPISPLKLRCYEFFAFYIAGLLPYFIIAPFLLLSVYYSGLWSSSQVWSFLAFQGFFWFVFANYALLLAMTGRLCWHIFLIVLMACLLYGFYYKNFSASYLNFIAVYKVLYKSVPLTLEVITKYTLLTITFLGIAVALSFSVNRRGFLWLHAKETGLSRGFSIMFLLIGLAGNIYVIGKFTATESAFSGLYLTKINEHPEVYWSSSVTLTDEVKRKYHASVEMLNRDIQAFAVNYELTLPKAHLQHNSDARQVKTLPSDTHASDSVEIELDFAKIDAHFADIERDIIIELLTFASKGWLGKEAKFIYLRGLAAHWSWRNLDRNLLNKRLLALSGLTESSQLWHEKKWLSLYQDSGACLFDAYASALISDVNNNVPKADVINYLRTRLNLDGLWLPLHIWRSLFQWASVVDVRANRFDAVVPSDTLPRSGEVPGLNSMPVYKIELKEIFPKVVQPVVNVDRLGANHIEAKVEFFEHKVPGRQVDHHKTEIEAIANSGELKVNPKLLLVKPQRFSTTLSWYRQDIECRVNLPWRYLEI